MTLDPALAKRAGAACLAAEPHSDDWPCARHIAEARRQAAIARHLSASASTSAARDPAARSADVDGAAGPLTGPPPVRPAAPPSEEAQP